MISVLGRFCQATYFSPSDTPDMSTNDTLSYTRKRKIHEGESSRVIEANCSQNEKTYVVKWPKNKEFYDEIRQESKILQFLNAQSPEDPEGKKHIITLIALFSLKEKPILLFPFYGNGDLYDLIISKGSLSLDQTLLIGKQLMKALIFLKQHLVIHRDIKPDNIVITDEGNIKLIDFEFARRTDETSSIYLCGTVDYLSPELLNSPNPNFPSDMWAAACTISLMITGRTLFDEENLYSLKKKHQDFFRNPSPFDTIIPSSSLETNQLKNALNQMMTLDSSIRSSPENGLNLLSKIDSLPSNLEADLVDQQTVSNALNQMMDPDSSIRSSPENGLSLFSEIDSLPSNLETDLVDQQADSNAITDPTIKQSDNNLNFNIELSDSNSNLEEDPCCAIQ